MENTVSFHASHTKRFSNNPPALEIKKQRGLINFFASKSYLSLLVHSAIPPPGRHIK